MSIKWRSPELLCFKTNELLCKVKAKASSPNTQCTTGNHIDEAACVELTTSETWGDGETGEIGCGVIAQCVEVGPLFGCDYDFYCSTMVDFFR